MGIGLVLLYAIVAGVLSIIFSAFDMPTVGNLPARFLGNIFYFYIWAVFACLIGYMIFKASDRLKLPS
jgi:hypothetical protein